MISPSWLSRWNQASHPDKRLRVYCLNESRQDEARFGQQRTTTNVWARTGSRPQVVRQTAYQYLWVLGVVCPETGQAQGLLSPKLNTEVVNAFLAGLSKSISEDERTVIIWDRAGFHRCGKLRMLANITPMELPAYRPELKAIKNLFFSFLTLQFFGYADFMLQFPAVI